MTTMDIKQKSLLVLTIAALGFLGYQIFELVDRDISETPVIAAHSSPTFVDNQSVKTPEHPVMAQLPSPVVPSKPAHAIPMSIKPVSSAQAPTISDSATQPSLNPSQQAYVKMLNTFEVEKMHRQLLDEEAAVATAQHQIAMLHQQTNKITGSDTGNDASTMDTAPLALSYVDKQRGIWSATIRLNRQYQAVSVGSTLQNGYQVIAIDRDGILLQKGQQRERLTFNGIQALPALDPTTHTRLAAAESKHPASINPAFQKKTLLNGVTQEQAKLLTMQITHHAKEVQAVARHALATTKPQPALSVSAKPIVVHLDKRATPKVTIQISTHDQYATESADDREAKLLTKDLDLRDTSIEPVVNQPYSVTAYLPQQAAVPQAYHLNLAMSAKNDANKYAVESADNVMPVAATTHYSAKERHFLSINQRYYTIQLIGSHDDAVVKQFLVDNEMMHIALPMIVGNPKKPWHIAVYGVYRSFDAAEHKLVHLPHRLRVNGAWIRKVGDIQSVLREYHHA